MTTVDFQYSGVVYSSLVAGHTTYPLTTSGGKPIAYIARTDIFVYLSPDDFVTARPLIFGTEWTFNSGGDSVVLSGAIAGALKTTDKLLLKRQTPVGEPVRIFDDSAGLTATALNQISYFLLYVAQEQSDLADNSGTGESLALAVARQAEATAALAEASATAAIASAAQAEAAAAAAMTEAQKPVVDAMVAADAAIAATKLAIQQSGGVVRTIADKLLEGVSVKDYGAKGDGTTDDTVAINAALAKGGRIHFPAVAAFYLITDELLVADNSTITGDGWKSEVRQTVQGKNGLVVGSQSVVRDLHVKMPNGNNLDLSKQNAIYINSKKNVIVENNWLELADVGVSGIQVRNTFNLTIKGNVIFGGLWSTGDSGAASAADILFYSGAPGGRVAVESNFCLSNNSQGIFFSALGQDYDAIISNNICVTLDPVTCIPGGTWAEQPSAGLKRRHGILASYSGAAQGTPRVVINANICRNTLWTGIYKQGPAQGPVIISNNICTLNGFDTSNPLGGGIFLHQSGGEIISNNSIEYCKTITATSGGITITSGDTPAPPPCLVVGNTISKSAGLGMAIAGSASKVEVRANLFLDNDSFDIYTIPAGGIADVAGHRIIGNRIRRSSGIAIGGIYVSHGASLLTTYVRDNEVYGFNNTNNSNLNTGIYVRGLASRTTVQSNRVENFFNGYFSDTFQTTDRDASIENNEFKACTNGIAMGASTNSQTIPVTGNRFIGILGSDVAAALGGGMVARVVQRQGKRLQWETTAAPVFGAWAVGDRSINTAPVVGQPKSWVCTVAGSPGTWVSEGVL